MVILQVGYRAITVPRKGTSVLADVQQDRPIPGIGQGNTRLVTIRLRSARHDLDEAALFTDEFLKKPGFESVPDRDPVLVDRHQRELVESRHTRSGQTERGHRDQVNGVSSAPQGERPLEMCLHPRKKPLIDRERLIRHVLDDREAAVSRRCQLLHLTAEQQEASRPASNWRGSSPLDLTASADLVASLDGKHLGYEEPLLQRLAASDRRCGSRKKELANDCPVALAGKARLPAIQLGPTP
jgi:hypothetical protein